MFLLYTAIRSSVLLVFSFWLYPNIYLVLLSVSIVICSDCLLQIHFNPYSFRMLLKSQWYLKILAIRFLQQGSHLHRLFFMGMVYLWLRCGVRWFLTHGPSEWWKAVVRDHRWHRWCLARSTLQTINNSSLQASLLCYLMPRGSWLIQLKIDGILYFA